MILKRKELLKQSFKFPFPLEHFDHIRPPSALSYRRHWFKPRVIKEDSNILALLAPPGIETDEYTGYVNSSKNTEIEGMLDQPNEKRSAVRKDVFIKGKQETLNDVLTFIANIIVFLRFWVNMSKDEDTPYIIEMLTEIADNLSSSEYISFNNKYKHAAKYMPNTLVSYIFNIFSIFVKAAKNPHIIRKYKIENTIDPK